MINQTTFVINSKIDVIKNTGSQMYFYVAVKYINTFNDKYHGILSTRIIIFAAYALYGISCINEQPEHYAI